MPGTGKTTTIAVIIQTLVSRGKTALLTSYTHTAVDNVLLKLKDFNVPFVRLGNPEKIHPALLPHTANHDGKMTSVEEYRRLYEDSMVVGTTCLGINHTLFSKRKFDYCIVDEASQLTLPVCLGPLRYCDVFVLVGDHYQLPPLVRNPEASENGLSVSLFKLLSEAHPTATVHLRHQYRMNAEILLLSNSLIYNHRLICGSDDVASSRFMVPMLNEVHQNTIPKRCVESRSCWISNILQPHRSVVFVDTDSVPAFETRDGDILRNEIEAMLAFQIVETMMLCGCEESSIGVISPYKSQLGEIGKYLHHRKLLELHTVDKYQGRDKECIVLSMVRSNQNNAVGELIRDWRRINVALTRAKQKLIIIGSRKTLSSCALFSDLLQIIESRGWILSLPADAQNHHKIDIPITLSQAQQQAQTFNERNANPTPQESKGTVARSSTIDFKVNRARVTAGGLAVKFNQQKKEGILNK